MNTTAPPAPAPAAPGPASTMAALAASGAGRGGPAGQGGTPFGRLLGEAREAGEAAAKRPDGRLAQAATPEGGGRSTATEASNDAGGSRPIQAPEAGTDRDEAAPSDASAPVTPARADQDDALADDAAPPTAWPPIPPEAHDPAIVQAGRTGARPGPAADQDATTTALATGTNPTAAGLDGDPLRGAPTLAGGVESSHARTDAADAAGTDAVAAGAVRAALAEASSDPGATGRGGHGARPGEPGPIPLAHGPSHAAHAASAAASASATFDGRPAGTTADGLAPPLHSPAFAPALAARVVLMLREGTREARLQLNPAELGPIGVRISVDGSQARVDLVADQAPTRQVLEQALPSLAGALREGGLTLAGGGVFDAPRDGAPDASRDGRSRQGDGRPGASGASAGGLAGTGVDGPADGALPAAPGMARGMLDLYA